MGGGGVLQTASVLNESLPIKEEKIIKQYTHKKIFKAVITPLKKFKKSVK